MLRYAFIISLIAFLSSLGSARAQAWKNSCPAVPSDSKAAGAWNAVLKNKRAALQGAVGALQKIRHDLVSEQRRTIGDVGSLRDAGNAITLVARETNSLIDTMISIIRGDGRVADQTIAHLVDLLFEEKAKDLIDYLPDAVPGKRLVKSLEELRAARREYGEALDKIEKSIRQLRKRLDDLGGTEQKRSLEDLIQLARVERQTCEASLKPPSGGVEARRPEGTPRAITGTTATSPIHGPCRMFGTC